MHRARNTAVTQSLRIFRRFRELANCALATISNAVTKRRYFVTGVSAPDRQQRVARIIPESRFSPERFLRQTHRAASMHALVLQLATSWGDTRITADLQFRPIAAKSPESRKQAHLPSHVPPVVAQS